MLRAAGFRLFTLNDLPDVQPDRDCRLGAVYRVGAEDIFCGKRWILLSSGQSRTLVVAQTSNDEGRV